MSNENIYYLGKQIIGADVDSFLVMNYAVSKDKNYVYFQGKVRPHFDSPSFEKVFSKYFKDKNGVYLHFIGLYQFHQADTETFEHLGGYYAKDKNTVYNLSPTYGMMMNGVDSDSFEYLGGWFGKDSENYYYRRAKIENLDFGSAEYLGSYYIKDEKNVFCGSTIIEGADAGTFEYISQSNGKDQYREYVNCKPDDMILNQPGQDIIYHAHDHNHDHDNSNIVFTDNSAQYCDDSETYPTYLDIKQKSSNNTQYNIHAELLYDTKTLSVSQKINYVNKTDRVTYSVPLILDKNRTQDVFCLGGIYDENNVLFSDYTYEGDSLLIQVEKGINPGERMKFYMQYKVDIPEASYDFGTYTEKQIRLTDWYPFIPPYQEGVFIQNAASKHGEFHAYDVSDFEIQFDLNSKYNLTVAASEKEYSQSATTYFFRSTNARNFTLIVSPFLEKIEKKVGDVLFQSFTFSYHTPESRALLDTVIQSYDFYTKQFGELDQEVLTFVEVDFIEAMEYQNMVVYGSAFYDHYNGGNRNLFIPIAVHEVAHQWWYGLVGNNQAITPWLDEGFTMWSEGYYFEKIYPGDYEWWKDFRMNRRNSTISSSGNITSTVYNFTDYADYIQSTYHLGVYYLEQIRSDIGEEKFILLLQEYIKNSQYKLADGKYFHELVEKNK
ncbi:MAG: hypothetical protein GY828_06955 [Candidatus Gracilibacteria bacterium]|nr:hypothetical protein [Candidatus Gracilibacteria bacterium]